MANQIKISLNIDDDNKQVHSNSSSQLKDAEKKIKNICYGLTVESQKYNSAKTAKAVEEYIKSNSKIERILYSQISNYIFSLDEDKRGTFSTNVDNLLSYALDKNINIEKDVLKAIVKIYDHFQLAINQIENVNSIFASSIEKTKRDIEAETTKSINNISKQIDNQTKDFLTYMIAVISIFAAVIFTALTSFNIITSIASAVMAKDNFYWVACVLAIVAFITINIFYILLRFISRIIDKTIFAHKNYIIILNTILGIAIIILFILTNQIIHIWPAS